MKIERFPHKPYINEDFPKNVTALIHTNVTFKCPIVSDLEPYMEWRRIPNKPNDQEKAPEGKKLEVHPLLNSVEVPRILLILFFTYNTSRF